MKLAKAMVVETLRLSEDSHRVVLHVSDLESPDLPAAPIARLAKVR
jgi:hypothetical protein